MSDAVLGSLIAAAGALLVALVGVVGPRLLARAQNKADENERRLRSLEEVNQHLIENLRRDADDARRREAEWRVRALKAERERERPRKDKP